MQLTIDRYRNALKQCEAIGTFKSRDLSGGELLQVCLTNTTLARFDLNGPCLNELDIEPGRDSG